MDPTSYYEQAPTEKASKLSASGAGDNPSTHAGLIVLGALVILVCARASFRRYM